MIDVILSVVDPDALKTVHEMSQQANIHFFDFYEKTVSQYHFSAIFIDWMLETPAVEWAIMLNRRQ